MSPIKFGKEKGNGGHSNKRRLVIERVGTLRDLPAELGLVTDSQEVQYIKELFGNPPEMAEFDGFLIKVGEGEITAVWGFHGNIPYLHKDAYSIQFKEG